MEVHISKTKEEMGARAAAWGSERIQRALAANGSAAIILATGASQFEMLAELVRADIDWSKITAFHLDEYIGLPLTHPASFRKYLRERFVEKLPVPIGAFHYIDGENDPEAECARVGALIAREQIAVAFVGIGENGHLAFNDPPADFEIEAPYLVVDLDDACRRQQLGEGWFPTFDDVPKQAISMSIRQIMQSQTVVSTVPDARKREAMQKTALGPVTPDAPASILQQHPDCRFFLDAAAGKGLE